MAETKLDRAFKEAETGLVIGGFLGAWMMGGFGMLFMGVLLAVIVFIAGWREG